MSTESACSTRPKHVELDDSIEELSHITMRLDRLLEKITGEVQPPSIHSGNTKTPAQDISLEQVLNQSSTFILGIRDSALKTIDEIEQKLF